MLKKKGRAAAQEINASSMADIAFLLLIFFLVTTTIASDKGLRIILPPKRDNQEQVKVELNEKNVYTILVNARNQLLVEGEYGKLEGLRKGIKTFITNNGKDEKSSENPQEAVVSYKTDRATQYKTYLRVLDEIKGAYNELRAELLKMPLDEYLKFNEKKEMDNPILIKKAQSFAETMQEPMSIRKYLNVDHKKDPTKMSPYEKKRAEAYKQARASARELLIEKYFDAKLVYPERISEAEPTKVEE
jgi:biopolymer transport protein ExbD